MVSQPTPRSTDDVTHWCGNVFEAFALTVENVVDCHDVLAAEDAGSVAGLVRAARSRPTTFPDPVTFVRDTLVESDRGVDPPGRYRANAPEVHLDALFAPFDCRVTVEWRRDDTRRILLEDADGTEFRATLTYPDRPLEQNNYPALLDAVNRNLLDGTGVELVLLNGPERRWQYALGETAALDNLRSRYGETVRFGSRRLLARAQPGDYVPEGDGEVPVPDWATESRDDEPLGLSLGGAGESFADLVERIDRSTESFADVDPDALCAGDERPPERATATDGIAAPLDDLSDVWPPTVPDDPAPDRSGSTPVLGTSAEPSSATDDEGAIDELFRRLERDVAMQAPGTGGDGADRTRESDPDATPEDVAAAASTTGDDPGVAADAADDVDVADSADADDAAGSVDSVDAAEADDDGRTTGNEPDGSGEFVVSGDCPSRRVSDDRFGVGENRSGGIDETIERSEFDWVDDRSS